MHSMTPFHYKASNAPKQLFETTIMANAKPEEKDNFPETGKVNQVCREWGVREDGALAYQLQNKEISEHYQGNKYRNAVVREDFPRALDEQLREQQLAERAAAVYHQMLAEQEEIDNQYAQQLSEKIQREERAKRREVMLNSFTPPYSPERNSYVKSPKRQALPMPLPCDISNLQDNYLYVEPCHVNDDLSNQFDRIDIAEIGLPLDDFNERIIQEQKDAVLAQQLQQQEDASEQSRLNRDRLLAIEAQDKELAKLLQERERQKAKRARERAKQKALAKKQQEAHQIMPDDSYANPIDSLPLPRNSSQNTQRPVQNQTCAEEDVNYSFPVDSYSAKNFDKSPKKINQENFNPPVRPTRLDLKAPLNYPSRTRYSELEFGDNQQTSSPSQLMNIAMAIDPTYNRRSHHSVPYCDTSSSTVTTSTSSSSPGIVLPPPPDTPEREEDSSPVPPYMPIQGQRRTASLEKKSKKKSKDGCKQQ